MTTARNHSPGSIVTGIEDLDLGRTATAWAANWAAGSGRGLHLVVLQAVDYRDGFATQQRHSVLQARVDALLDELREHHPEREFTHEIGWDSPAQVLTAAATEAEAVVVPPRLTAPLIGQVNCPIVSLPFPEAPGRVPDGPVAVGLEDTDAAKAATRFAFGYAAAQGSSVWAVHAWEPPRRAGMVTQMAYQTPAWVPDGATVDHTFGSVLTELEREHPDLPVRRSLGRKCATLALTEASREASLLVVGASTASWWERLLFGSTSRKLLRTSACPVVVVPSCYGATTPTGLRTGSLTR